MIFEFHFVSVVRYSVKECLEWYLDIWFAVIKNAQVLFLQKQSSPIKAAQSIIVVQNLACFDIGVQLNLLGSLIDLLVCHIVCCVLHVQCMLHFSAKFPFILV